MVIVLPAQPGANDPRWSLVSWPRHDDAPSWRALPLVAALEREWNVDAHVFGYTDLAALGANPPAWRRYSQEILADPVAESVFLCAAFADLDRPGHAPWPGPADAQAAVAAVAAAYPEAMAVYSSRAGIRIVWRLGELVPLKHAGWWLAAWHVAAKARLPAGVGVEWDDSAAQWSRCFRLPRVTRDGAPTGPTSNLVLRPDATVSFTPPGEPTVEVAGAATGGPQPEKIPPAPPDWPAWVAPGSAAGPLVSMLLSGAAFGPPVVPAGTRNTMLLKVAHSLASQLGKRRGGVTATDLYAVLGPSVEAGAKAGGPSLSDLWRMCLTAAGKEEARRPPAVTVAPAAPPPLVGYRDNGFIFDATLGTYRGPFGGADLYLALRDFLPEVPRTRKSSALRPIPEILESSAVRAESVELHYPGVRPKVAWVAASRTVRVETFRAPSVPAERCEVVERWIELMFGSTRAAMAWTGNIARLDRPMATLYLQGPPGAGKGLFAAMLAGLWRTSPLAMRDAIGRFTDPLMRSPIVLLDEHMNMDRELSGSFRSLVSQDKHRIEIKGKPVLDLYGCPRIIVASNGDGALDLIGGSHGAEDMDAIIDRILHIEVTNAPVEYLSSLGGRAGTHDWVWTEDGEPGRAVRHLAWMIANAEPARGKRFLVDGEAARYHSRLITSDPLHAAVLAAVAKALIEGGGPGIWCAPAGDPEERIPGCVWVNPTALHTRFRALVAEDIPRPTLQRVAQACGALSRSTAARVWDGMSYWPIPGELVRLVAEDVGLANAQRVAAALATGTVASKAAGEQPIVIIGRSA